MTAKIINLSNKQYCHFCGSMLKPADQHMYCDDILCEICLDAELSDMESKLGGLIMSEKTNNGICNTCEKEFDYTSEEKPDNCEACNEKN